MAKEKITISKIITAGVVAIFLAIFTYIGNDVREIRNSNQKQVEELSKLHTEMEVLKVKVKYFWMLPPSDEPKPELGEIKYLVELLKEKEE